VTFGPGQEEERRGSRKNTCEEEEKSCDVDNGGCDVNANCMKFSDGEIGCQCKDGYTGTGVTCEEEETVKSCDVDNGGCDVNADCMQFSDGYIGCRCKTGFSGSGVTCVEDTDAAVGLVRDALPGAYMGGEFKFWGSLFMGILFIYFLSSRNIFGKQYDEAKEPLLGLVEDNCNFFFLIILINEKNIENSNI